MQINQNVAPESTAERVALWRALHVQVDPLPHVLEDEIGLKLVAPGDGWRDRQDMNPQYTRRFRASIVARARFIEDWVIDHVSQTSQYVILGAGLDTFAQRRPEIASLLRVFEVDRPGPQAWKRQRLVELGYTLPTWLRFVPVDFEGGGPWWEKLVDAGFDIGKKAVVVSTGVSMYLTKEAIRDMSRQITLLAPGSTFVMTFILPLELVEPEERPGFEAAIRGARSSGTPFVSFFTPSEILALAREVGFREIQHVSAGDLTRRYFMDRADGLRPGSEELLVATV